MAPDRDQIMKGENGKKWNHRGRFGGVLLRFKQFLVIPIAIQR